MPRLCLHLQVGRTVDSVREARGPTAMEIQVFIEDCYKAWKKKQRGTDAAVPAELTKPIWSLDATSIHTCAINDKKWDADRPPGNFKVAQVPPYSPDLHKVIEHVHGIVTEWFRDAKFKMIEAPRTIEAWFDVVKEGFYAIHKTSIQNDITSLLDTYKATLKRKGAFSIKKTR